jgi:hypothetical protein
MKSLATTYVALLSGHPVWRMPSSNFNTLPGRHRQDTVYRIKSPEAWFVTFLYFHELNGGSQYPSNMPPKRAGHSVRVRIPGARLPRLSPLRLVRRLPAEICWTRTGMRAWAGILQAPTKHSNKKTPGRSPANNQRAKCY